MVPHDFSDVLLVLKATELNLLLNLPFNRFWGSSDFRLRNLPRDRVDPGPTRGRSCTYTTSRFLPSKVFMEKFYIYRFLTREIRAQGEELKMKKSEHTEFYDLPE